ncbi:zinc finger BED domain-containing protein 4-like [Anopheles funestus]|uniref:zinc finger BED domain-containing protein 4-like n=1 Tax=Anopheles funestus TaxID=62324 RepID=UPI0020C73960|nr:zinc finger BED domain-containing protein 4-like [Anopheles funestus]
MLACEEFPHKRTSENIAEWLEKIMEQFQCSIKVTCIVTDNAPNMKKAVSLLGIENIPCFAHSLNLIVQHAINNSIQSTVATVKKIVKYFKKVPKLPQSFENFKLILDVATRWNSTYYMLERFHTNKDPIISSLALLNFENTLNEHDWVIMHEASIVLNFFDLVTKEISAEKTVTLSKVKVITSSMIKKLQVHLQNSSYSEQTKTLITLLLEGIQQKFNYMDSEVVQLATILDPRFKQRGFNSDRQFNQCCAHLLQKIKSINSIDQRDSIQQPQDKTDFSNDDKNTIWEDFDMEQGSSQVVLNTRSEAQKEIDNYLAEPLTHRNDDPLDWWKLYKNKYPLLHSVMLETLCIPASYVPCERVFSKAGDVETSKRNRLKPNKLNKILFVKQNKVT